MRRRDGGEPRGEWMIQGVLTLAGERLGVECAIRWVGELIARASE